MILECLASVAAQTRLPDTVVVVDDGSKDSTAQVVVDWIERQSGAPLFRLVTLPDSAGASRARNRGLEALEAYDFVSFLDSDDLWPTDFLARAEAVLVADDEAVAASADIRIERPGKEPRVRSLESMDFNVAGTLFRDAGIGSATCVRTEALLACGGFDESLGTGHDLALFLAMSALGRWRHLPGEPIEKRRGDPDSGDEGSLSLRFADRHHRSAELHERLIQEHGARLGLDARTRARMIALRWYRAGAAKIEQNDREAARICLRKSIRWRPGDLRTRLRLLGTYLP